MIKPENYGKITENSRNLLENPVKTLKICRRASLDVWGGVLPIFSMTGGGFG